MKTEAPLTEEESALLGLAGWHHAGGGIIDRKSNAPFADGLVRLYFRHDDGHTVAWLRAEARAEAARVRALWTQVPALQRVARALRNLDTLIDFGQALDQECMVFADQAAINAAMTEARAALAALESEAPQ